MALFGVFSAHAEVVPPSTWQNTVPLVFSAHAEVVPWGNSLNNGLGSILRARGGSSKSYDIWVCEMLYSPRTRR